MIVYKICYELKFIKCSNSSKCVEYLLYNVSKSFEVVLGKRPHTFCLQLFSRTLHTRRAHMSYLSRAVADFVLETCLQSESSFFIVCLRNFRSTTTGQECCWGLHTISDLPFCVEMFSSKRHLETKTPVDGVGRLEFLQQLVTEFQTSNDNGSYSWRILFIIINILMVHLNLQRFKITCFHLCEEVFKAI